MTRRQRRNNHPARMRFGKAGTGVGVLAVGAVVAGTSLVSAKTNEESGEPATSVEHASTAQATAERGDLTEEVKINGLVGYGDSFRLPIEAQGTVTGSPEAGTVLGNGDTAVTIDQRPVVILRSPLPLYRELRQVGSGERDEAGTKLGPMKGDDVQTLQTYLLEEGFDDKGRLKSDGTFGASTKRAVKAWQAEVGHPATGRIDRSQMIFIPYNVRVEVAPRLGSAFDSITVTEPAIKVTGTVTSKQKGFFPVGSTVRLDADGTELSGTVTELKREVGADGSTQFALHIEVAGLPSGAEAVRVTATKTVAQDQVTIPVTALVALVDGGWAVEVVNPGGTELTAVELVDVVDTRAAVTGINEGTEVLVPS